MPVKNFSMKGMRLNMKMVGVFDVNEQTVSYRLAGIKTYLVKDSEGLEKVLLEIKEDKNIGILMFNENTYSMAKDKIEGMKKQNLPLIIKI